MAWHNPRMSLRLASIALVLAAACGGPSRKPATTPVPAATSTDDAAEPAATDPDFEATMRAGITFIDELAAEVTAAAGDCPKVAAAIETTFARHQPTLDKIAAYGRDPALKARSETWVQAHQDELGAAAEKLDPAIGPCKDDPAVQAAAGKAGA